MNFSGESRILYAVMKIVTPDIISSGAMLVFTSASEVEKLGNLDLLIFISLICFVYLLYSLRYLADS